MSHLDASPFWVDEAESSINAMTILERGYPTGNYLGLPIYENTMHMRRFTRLTNGFSKKLENHIAAISLHFMYYNFVRIHQTLRITPAMAAGVTDRVWEIADIVRLLDEAEQIDYTTDAHYGPALGQDPQGRRHT